MPENRGAVVFPAAALDAELVCQHGVAAGGVDHELRLTLPLPITFLQHRNRRAMVMEFNPGGTARFDRRGAFTHGIAKKNMVELRTAHLISVGKGLVHCVRKIISDGPGVPGRYELGAVFGHAHALDFLAHAEPFEKRQIERQQRLTDVKTRVPRFLDQYDIASAPRQQGRYRRPARPTAYHQDITSGGRLSLRFDRVEHSPHLRPEDYIGIPSKYVRYRTEHFRSPRGVMLKPRAGKRARKASPLTRVALPLGVTTASF